MKHCNKCKQDKEDKDFTAKAKYCRDCVKAANRARLAALGVKAKFSPIVNEDSKQCTTCKLVKNLDEFGDSKRGKLGKSAYCKPCWSQYQLSYTSKEERRKKTQTYRDNNREWWRTLHRINQFNRRAKIKAVSDGTVTPDFAKSIYALSICHYCKEDIQEKFRTLEHKQPLNKGGLHSASNITMACFVCNSTKRDMTEEEYISYINNKIND